MKAPDYSFRLVGRLIMRFRWILFNAMNKKVANNFKVLIDNLHNEAQKLISKNII